MGWGGALREIFAEGAADAPISAELLQACVGVLKDWAGEGWSGQDLSAAGGSGGNRPVAVVSIPARARPLLTRSFAQGIADIGRLPYLGELSLAHGGPRGSRGGNSAYRLAGVWDRLVVGPELAASLAEQGVVGGTVLLVDDLVDSRWTMTLAARALRQAGVGAVLPLLLAQAG